MKGFLAVLLVLATPLAAQQSEPKTVWDVRTVTCS
jgi:hypothetical protein